MNGSGNGSTSAGASDDFFAPPPFKPVEALTLIKRDLRALKPLAERGAGYEVSGRVVLVLSVTAAGDAIEAKLAKRPAVSPDWEKSTIRSSADQRKFMDAVKARLLRWTDED